MFRLSFLFFTCFVVAGNSIYAQTPKINQLKNNIHTAINEQQRLSAILLFCDETESVNADTLSLYALAAKKLAIKKKNTDALAQADYYLAASLYQQSLPDSANSIVNAHLPQLAKQNPAGELYLKY